MIKPKAFISFDIDSNKVEKDLFVSELEKSGIQLEIEGCSSELLVFEAELDYLIRKRIDKYNMLTKTNERAIEPVINACQIWIVLVGNSTFVDGRVTEQIAYAKSKNIPIFGVYVAEANDDTDLPRGLSRDRIVVKDWEKIDLMIKYLLNKDRIIASK